MERESKLVAVKVWRGSVSRTNFSCTKLNHFFDYLIEIRKELIEMILTGVLK